MTQREFYMMGEQYILDEFQFQNGKTLKNAVVEYGILGTPKFDEDGNITNAILFCHGFSGDYSSISEFYPFTKEGSIFDKNKYFFITITSLGFPNSASPSTTNLKYEFPKYTFEDLTNFKRQFIKEKFPIKKFKGMFGRSIGGYEVLTWATKYPDEMDFIILFSTTYKTSGHKYVFAKCGQNLIDSNPNYYSDVYDESLSTTLVSIIQLMFSNHLPKPVLTELSNEEIDILMDNYVDESLFMDIYDIKYRNDANLVYDLENELHKIKAKTLVIGVLGDVYYRPDLDVYPFEDLIDDCEVMVIDFNEKYDFEKIEKEVIDFLDKKIIS